MKKKKIQVQQMRQKRFIGKYVDVEVLQKENEELMEILVDGTFFKDLDKLKSNFLYAKIDKVIEEIKTASALSEIKNLKKLSAGKAKD